MQKDDATWLRVAYVCFGLTMAYIAYMAFYTVSIQMEWEERYYNWIPAVRWALAFIVGIASFYFIGADKERHEYFLASIGEVRKVTFPTANDTKRMTVVVVIVVVIFSFVLWVFDMLWSKSLAIFLS